MSIEAAKVATARPARAKGQRAVDQPASAPSPRRPWARRGLVGGAAIAALLVLVLAPPDVDELAEVPGLVAGGDPVWLAAALVFEVLSFAGYVALFRAVFVDEQESVGWRESYAITMAGLVASRVFAAAGAGGIALTAWALRRLGVGARRIADRMVAFLILLYGVYMGCLVLFGLGLWTGLLGGAAPWPLTLVPAALGALVIAGGLALTRLPVDLDQRLGGRAEGAGALGRLLARGGHVPAAAGRGARVAVSLLRGRRLSLAGAPAWWGFDIAVLWATFHAFGEPPALAVLVIAYFVGMLGNLLPVPGGVGGVEGGMIGALVAFGVGGGLALVAVIAYRVFAFWLPMLPGALAYLQLRRAFAARPRHAVALAGLHQPVALDEPGLVLAGAALAGPSTPQEACEPARPCGQITEKPAHLRKSGAQLRVADLHGHQRILQPRKDAVGHAHRLDRGLEKALHAS